MSFSSSVKTANIDVMSASGVETETCELRLWRLSCRGESCWSCLPGEDADGDRQIWAAERSALQVGHQHEFFLFAYRRQRDDVLLDDALGHDVAFYWHLY